VAHPFFAISRPIVIGHRGCAGERPENTLASFEAGLAAGATVLESDVHLTRDRVPVLIHDDEVGRCTEGVGRVSELDLDALQKLDAGHHFTRNGGKSFPERGRGHRIPTLQEVLEAFPGARLNLELKEDVAGLVERTVEVVASADRAASCLLTTADDAMMRTLRAHVAREDVPVALGACTGEVAGFAISAVHGRPPPDGPMALQIPTEFAGQPLVTPELIGHAHAHGVQIHVWTIDEPEEMTALLDLGVDGIVTDFPARMVHLLEQRP
jgi:glycerophosphoryl diester phosphodiesterase